MAERGFVRRPAAKAKATTAATTTTTPPTNAQPASKNLASSTSPAVLVGAGLGRSWTRIRSELGFLENPRDAGRRGALPALTLAGSLLSRKVLIVGNR
jgi:hypothetical protein